MMRERLAARAQLLAHCRQFFAQRNVLEVDTPLLSQAAVTDPHLDSLQTRIAGHAPTFYLQTSPEHAMKRLLAAGVGDCYQICKVFRDGETGRNHNPEFTMLEWYRLGFDQYQLMDEVEALLTTALGAACQAPAERLSYQAIFERYLAIDPHLCPVDTLRALCRDHAQADLPNADRDTLLNALIGIVIGPQLGHDRLTFVHDFPASQAALARLLPGNPPVAARFEAYARGLELCNGFHELTQPDEQRRRFEQDLGQRAALGLPAVPLDERLIAALQVGLPDCAGVAVGLDRVLMVAMGAERIQDVLAFAVTEC